MIKIKFGFRLIATVLVILLYYCKIFSTGLAVQNIRTTNQQNLGKLPTVQFDVRWENAWHNEKNHDAVWIFMKFSGYYNNHVKIAPTGHRVLINRGGNNSNLRIEVSDEQSGFFIYPGESFRGTVDVRLSIQLDTAGQTINRQRLSNFKVFGLEMVYIPEGPFQVGEPNDRFQRFACLYRSDDSGEHGGLYSIESESAITVGPSNGQLYYWSENPTYNGDQKGPIPTEFPKGFHPFYIMKYELNQGQYADFLNDLADNYTYLRSPIGGRNYHANRGSISFIKGRYSTDKPHRPMNYIGFMDALAYTDWAALRPITELEFTKAARGPEVAYPGGYVWGNSDLSRLERFIDPELELVFTNGWNESRLSDDTRPQLGASYYWVMDLSGSVWEKVITIGNEVGRRFTGSHGDGLMSDAKHTNPDWPESDNEDGGFGYRGGGYYHSGMPYDDFNPHSPVAFRYYGAWSGGPRYIAYGYRAGRTKPTE